VCGNFPILKRFVIFIAFLSALAVVVGFAVNAFRENPLPLLYKDKVERLEDAVARIQASEPKKAMSGELPETVGHEAMKEIVEKGEAIILDARPELFHRLGHIPSALSLPRDEFEQGYKAIKEILEANKNRQLVIYCANDTCKDAELVCEALKKLGYTRILIYVGGWSEWQRYSVTNDQ